MKIYSSTEYIEPKDERVGMLKLEVINMWDWTTPVICFETIYKGESNEKSIAFALKRCTEVVEPKWTKWEKIKPEGITNEMIEALERMGLVISQKLSSNKGEEI